MATTLATKKQAEAIKHRMAELRTELPYSADAARFRVQQLTDWKYHMSRRPWPILAAVAVVGYLVVPQKRSPERLVRRPDTQQVSDASQPAKKGMLGGIMGALVTIAIKQATQVAARQFSDMIQKRGSA